MDSVITSPNDRFRCFVLGVPVDACRDVWASVLGIYFNGGGRIVTLNAEMTMAARVNANLFEAIDTADLVIPDGAGVVWALSRQGVRVIKIPGIELAWSLLEYASKHSWRVALVGASPTVMGKLKKILPQRLPGINIILAVDGYNSEEIWSNIEAKLRHKKPDLVLMALGVPRQEVWSKKVRNDCEGIWMGVGGSFDIWSGLKKRAPQWMRVMQLEWLYRLIQEPSRWRRMLSVPAFALAVLRGK